MVVPKNVKTFRQFFVAACATPAHYYNDFHEIFNNASSKEQGMIIVLTNGLLNPQI